MSCHQVFNHPMTSHSCTIWWQGCRLLANVQFKVFLNPFPTVLNSWMFTTRWSFCLNKTIKDFCNILYYYLVIFYDLVQFKNHVAHVQTIINNRVFTLICINIDGHFGCMPSDFILRDWSLRITMGGVYYTLHIHKWRLNVLNCHWIKQKYLAAKIYFCLMIAPNEKILLIIYQPH